jgi:hypothetical protein
MEESQLKRENAMSDRNGLRGKAWAIPRYGFSQRESRAGDIDSRLADAAIGSGT